MKLSSSQYLGATTSGISVSDAAYADHALRTGFHFERDIVGGLEQLSLPAALQGYNEVSRYMTATPRNDTEWQRYEDSYQALINYVSTQDTKNPTARSSTLATLGLTEFRLGCHL